MLVFLKCDLAYPRAFYSFLAFPLLPPAHFLVRSQYAKASRAGRGVAKSAPVPRAISALGVYGGPTFCGICATAHRNLHAQFSLERLSGKSITSRPRPGKQAIWAENRVRVEQGINPERIREGPAEYDLVAHYGLTTILPARHARRGGQRAALRHTGETNKHASRGRKKKGDRKKSAGRARRQGARANGNPDNEMVFTQVCIAQTTFPFGPPHP
ncbi:hypothetical protein HPB48_001239 [Haemaphysalis longicornis]|uniref:Uncharacterized protein n=1 Tax=Haemaphysalis longicornis TaxID=44386 RepID=A0A9J6FJS5_HAELO|nr:hypothetical protein HPB48_001239 [Haemaphysalis longicornis]